MTTSLNAYARFFRAWPVKVCGPKPTAAQFDLAAAACAKAGQRFTDGSKVALALAMYARPGGATQAAIITACGGPQLNKLRGLIATGGAVKVAMPTNEAGHTVYRMALAKGKGKATPVTKAAPKGKAKGKGKARLTLVRAKPTPAPVTPVTAPAPVDSGDNA
jgi:hypothetical protein